MDSKLREWLLTDEGVYRLYDSELSIISLSDCRKSEKIPFILQQSWKNIYI